MADRQFTQRDLDDARAKGRAAAEAELLPFHGVDRVLFPRDRPHFAGCQLYESRLLEHRHFVLSLVEDARIEEEHAVEAKRTANIGAGEQIAAAEGSNRLTTAVLRTTARSKLSAAQQRASERVTDAVAIHHDRLELADRLAAELVDVRAWLDQHVDEAAAYAATREGVRRETDPLYGVTFYADRRDFVAQDREGRDGGLFLGEDRPGGVPYGEWTWEEPERPWIVTRWAAYWLDNGEIYAWERTNLPDPEFTPSARRGERANEPVLLLGCVPRPRVGSNADFLGPLQTEIRGRNTLVALAQAVVEHERLGRNRRAVGELGDEATPQ